MTKAEETAGFWVESVCLVSNILSQSIRRSLLFLSTTLSRRALLSYFLYKYRLLPNLECRPYIQFLRQLDITTSSLNFHSVRLNFTTEYRLILVLKIVIHDFFGLFCAVQVKYWQYWLELWIVTRGLGVTHKLFADLTVALHIQLFLLKIADQQKLSCMHK